MFDAPLRADILAQYDALPRRLQAAARWALDHPQDVALLSMREQARRAGVVPVTMTRLAQRLGYSGYEAIRALYVEKMRRGGTVFSGRAKALVERRKLKGDTALAFDLLDTLARQMHDLASGAAREQLKKAALQLGRAERIYVFGQRSSFPVAFHLAYVLGLAHAGVRLLDGPGATGADALRGAGKSDALVAISVRPYTRDTVETTEFAVRQGIPLIALTDSEVSPLCGTARASILVPTESPVILSHHGAGLRRCRGAGGAGRGGDGSRSDWPPCGRWSGSSALYRRIFCRVRRWRANDDANSAPPNRSRLSRRRRRQRCSAVRCGRAHLSRCVWRRGGVVPRPWPSRRPRRHASPVRQACLRPHQLLHHASRPKRWPSASVADAPGDLRHVYFVSGGSEGVEAALKMARQYFVERGERGRRHFIARRQSYHGNTLGALAIGGNRWRQGSLRSDPDGKPSCRALLRLSLSPRRRDRSRVWRTRRSSSSKRRSRNSAPRPSSLSSPRRWWAQPSARAGSARLLPARPRHLLAPRHSAHPRRSHVRHGPHRGAPRLRSGGHRARLDGGRQRAGRRLCADRRGAAVRAYLSRPLPRGSGVFQHGHTYIGHPLACAAALAVQEVIQRDNLLDNVQARGAQLAAASARAFRQSSPYRRCSRPRPIPKRRTRCRPRHARRRLPRQRAFMHASRPRR